MENKTIEEKEAALREAAEKEYPYDIDDCETMECRMSCQAYTDNERDAFVYGAKSEAARQYHLQQANEEIEATPLNELLQWLNEFDNKNFKPTYANMREKIWQLLPEENSIIQQANEEIQRLKELLKEKEFVMLSEREPITYKSGLWDGLASDPILVQDSEGINHVAVCYSGIIDGEKFVDFYGSHFQIENVVKWKNID